ncbi:2,3-bisphosphoglycerate-independent phosphoglycerate mutase [Candidatus Babeliales bacterium]|nr:2,3-bisphosphoglycerate-independent phosphoglycerate mutase [Candidatus Babeliales bacterium]
MPKNKKEPPTILIILDGFGYRKEESGNAVKAANMPNWKKWLKIYPSTLLNASGEAVGLMPFYMGNSEVGHTCLGSGRIVKTALIKFHEAVMDGSFFKNKMLLENFKKIKKHNSSLHLMGLISDAGVHSHQENLYSILKLVHKNGLKKVFIHAFLDGRDTPPKSAKKFLMALENLCRQLDCGQIASLHGRFYAMDRDNNWERTKKSYDVLCKAPHDFKSESWQNEIEKSYLNEITDEFFEPHLLLKDGIIKKEDGIFFFNFRPDRANQITEPFINPNFDKFKTEQLNSTTSSLSFFVTTTRYKKEFEKFNNQILFEKEKIEHTLLDEISEQTFGKKIFVIAETEKYAHVTYFFRGMVEKRLPNESFTLIPSIKVKNYINHPKMSAEKITNSILESLKTDPAYFYLVNYANPDMVGHSGNFNATVKACEFLDKQLAELYKQVIEKQNGTIFITSDHGNAEEMIDVKTGKPKTSHTNNPVIFIIINKSSPRLRFINKKLKTNKKEIQYDKPTLSIANIAPTILKYLGLKIPKEMIQKTIF